MNQKIKILHVIKSLGRGGAEMLLPETLRVHNKDLFEFHYIYFLPWKDAMVSSILELGGKVTCIAARNNIELLFKATAVSEYAMKHGIDLIHSHLPWAGVASRIAGKLSGIPVIYTEHNKQERYHFLTRLANRFTFNWQNAVICVSKDVAESIEKNIRPRITSYTILNGVNTDFFTRDVNEGKRIRQQLNIPEDAIVIGTIAVFRFQKRLKEWLDVFERVSTESPNIYGIIVGDGPLKEELLKHRLDLGLEHKVIMPGLQNEVKPWYSAMDIFMMTSVFEGLPVALLEAMSMECTVVVTNAGGIREVVEHGTSGQVREVDAWKSLDNDIAQILKNELLRRELAHGGRERVREAFGMERMVKELENLYLQVVPR